jgi:hypothetical protein
MKQLILIVLLVLSINTYAQDDKTVTLVVSGQGKTQDEAKQNALRSAIEQAFGTFISSKTEILNENLVKDEIVSVANGNIQKFEIISEVQISNGGYATTLKATVSVTKLTSFVESKGVVAEFKGSLFAFNVNQQILNEKNEIKAMEDLSIVIKKLSDASFNYSIKVSDPIALNANNEQWRISLDISIAANKNLVSLANYIYQNLKGLSLSRDEALNYIRLGKVVYPISFSADKNNFDYFLLRNENSAKRLISLLYYFNHSIQNFEIENGIEKFRISDRSQNNLMIDDKKFRPFVLKVGECMAREIYSNGSVFFDAMGSNGYDNITMSKVPILDWAKWATLSRRWHGCGFGWSEYYVGYDFRSYSTQFPYGDFFNQNFSFLEELSSKLVNRQSGLIIDFSDILINQEIIKISLNDVKSLAEINKISAYKVSPIVN